MVVLFSTFTNKGNMVKGRVQDLTVKQWQRFYYWNPDFVGSRAPVFSTVPIASRTLDDFKNAEGASDVCS